MKFLKKDAPLLLYGLDSERLLFREVLTSDYNDWFRFCEDPTSLMYIFSKEMNQKSPKEKCDFWFERLKFRAENKLGGMNALVEKESGRLVGQCGLLIQEIDGIQELEIGYSIMPEFRGQGFAFEAAHKCKAFAIQNQLSKSLISVIIPENYASINVATKNGMQLDKQTVQNGDVVSIYRLILQNA